MNETPTCPVDGAKLIPERNGDDWCPTCNRHYQSEGTP